MFFGLIITVIGFMLLLEKLSILPPDSWGYFWPLLIVVIGLSMMYNKMNHNHYLDECCFRGEHGHKKHREASKRGAHKHS